MEKFSKFLMLITAAIFFVIADCNAQKVVRVLPTRPSIAARPRPPRPSPKSVWVSEEWLPSRNGYIYNPGYWSPPPRRGSVYLPGRWAKHGPGFVWVTGHWRK